MDYRKLFLSITATILVGASSICKSDETGTHGHHHGPTISEFAVGAPCYFLPQVDPNTFDIYEVPSGGTGRRAYRGTVVYPGRTLVSMRRMVFDPRGNLVSDQTYQKSENWTYTLHTGENPHDFLGEYTSELEARMYLMQRLNSYVASLRPYECN